MASKKSRFSEPPSTASSFPAPGFTKDLLAWNQEENDRTMPWKGIKDPYRIWLSEVILQQTRVEQGLKYYENFIKQYPDVKALAAAKDDEVFKLWEGLGYYSRCRNLLFTARQIANERNGVFPSTYEEILQLKGVGSYTAAAIASFAFQLPHAVVDGNVYRVLARITDNETPTDTLEGKKIFTQLADTLLSKEQPGIYNQAIMDFGATVCKPFPLCKLCFYSNRCKAYRYGHQELLPVKSKRTKQRQRWLNYIVLRAGEKIAVRQRSTKDIWQNLYEFFLIETEKEVTAEKLLEAFADQYRVKTINSSRNWQIGQKLSHQSIQFTFILADVEQELDLPSFRWLETNEVRDLPFPRALQKLVEELS